MVDTGIEAEHLHHIRAFFGTAGRADDPTAASFGELSDDAADWAARRRNQQRFARLRFRQMQADPGGDARPTEHAENEAWRIAVRRDQDRKSTRLNSRH